MHINKCEIGLQRGMHCVLNAGENDKNTNNKRS